MHGFSLHPVTVFFSCTGLGYTKCTNNALPNMLHQKHMHFTDSNHFPPKRLARVSLSLCALPVLNSVCCFA